MIDTVTPKQSMNIHVWHLEMTEPPTKAPAPTTRYELRKADTPQPELNRYLYAAVGAAWLWYMRLEWSWQQWHDFLNRPEVETWIAFQGATPVGYFELQQHQDGSTEIVYFGLIPEYIGKGIGRPLLEDAIHKAWQLTNSRIWLHTCTLDHPNALPNYKSRGFRVFKEEDFVDQVPVGPLEPWPGAQKYPVN